VTDDLLLIIQHIIKNSQNVWLLAVVHYPAVKQQTTKLNFSLVACLRSMHESCQQQEENEGLAQPPDILLASSASCTANKEVA
jgi:hypothetical protein